MGANGSAQLPTERPSIATNTDPKSEDVELPDIPPLRLPEFFIKAVTALYKATATADGMNCAKFCDVFTSSESIKLSPDLKEFLSSIFRGYDVNRNEKMDLIELLEMFDVILCGSSVEKAQGLFQMCDYDGDGFITRDELTNFMKSLQWANESGQRDELLCRAIEMFERFDSDGDGNLTKVEFLDGCKKHPQMAKFIQDIIDKCFGKFGK